MQFKSEATLLTAESKPYNIDGNAGTSHRIRVNVEGEIYACKSTAEQVNSLKEFEGKKGEVVLKVLSRKENLSLQLVSFVPED